MRDTRKYVKHAVMLGALVVGVVGFGVSSPASAGGTSNTTYNCYTQWWSTAWAQKCPNGATKVGNYESSVSCSAQGTRYKTVYRLAGDSRSLDGADCTFSVGNGKLTYLGY